MTASLFAEMDKCAAAMMRANPHVLRDDLQIEFRQIQKAHMPELRREQWLVALWHDGYTARLKAKHDAAVARLSAIRDKLPPGEPFICPCGESLRSFGPEEAALHGEHIYLSQF